MTDDIALDYSLQAYSMDMYYTVFKSDPMNAEHGLRYRRTVLEKGSSRDSVDMLRDLLGREPSAEAFYQELGIGNASATGLTTE